MTVNQKIENALGSLVDNQIWPLAKPTEVVADAWIVYNPELEEAVEYGDDTDLAWIHSMQIHYFAKGHVNYIAVRKQIRNRLRNIGFSMGTSREVYESDTDITHMTVTCNIIEEDPYGES